MDIKIKHQRCTVPLFSLIVYPDYNQLSIFFFLGNYISKDRENVTHSFKEGQPGASFAFKIKNVYNASDENPNETFSKFTSTPFPANAVRSRKPLADAKGTQRNEHEDSVADKPYFEKYGKTKNSVILKKFQLLNDINNGFNETDV